MVLLRGQGDADRPRAAFALAGLALRATVLGLDLDTAVLGLDLDLDLL